MTYTWKDERQRQSFLSNKYKRTLEANKGRNFEYWSEKHDLLISDKGWSIFSLERSGSQWGKVFLSDSTTSVDYAKKVVENLRSSGNFARTVCGYTKDRQRRKYFTVIYKSKIATL